MIIGSQNINDRSLRGSRDSEIGICVFDDEKKVIILFYFILFFCFSVFFGFFDCFFSVLLFCGLVFLSVFLLHFLRKKKKKRGFEKNRKILNYLWKYFFLFLTTSLIFLYSFSFQVETTFSGTTCQVSSFIQNFRLRLWKEHLGVADFNLMKYVSASLVFFSLFFFFLFALLFFFFFFISSFSIFSYFLFFRCFSSIQRLMFLFVVTTRMLQVT